MFCALVAITVSTVSAVGNTPIPRIPDHRRPLRNRCGLAPGTTARPVPYFKAPVFTTIPGAYEEPSCPIASHSDRRGHGGDEIVNDVSITGRVANGHPRPSSAKKGDRES